MSATDTQRLLTLDEVARHYDVDRGTVSRWCREERIAAVKTPGGAWRIPASVLEDREDQ